MLAPTPAIGDAAGRTHRARGLRTAAVPGGTTASRARAPMSSRILDTLSVTRFVRALPNAIEFMRSPYYARGAKLLQEINDTVPIYHDVIEFAALGNDKLASVRFTANKRTATLDRRSSGAASGHRAGHSSRGHRRLRHRVGRHGGMLATACRRLGRDQCRGPVSLPGTARESWERTPPRNAARWLRLAARPRWGASTQLKRDTDADRASTGACASPAWSPLSRHRLSPAGAVSRCRKAIRSSAAVKTLARVT